MFILSSIKLQLFIYSKSVTRKEKHFNWQHYLKALYVFPWDEKQEKSILTTTCNTVRERVAKTMKQEKERYLN